jgi:Ca2+-transporting ATPase
MSRPPRDPQAAILSRGFLSVTVLYAVLLTAATLASFLWALEVREVDSRRAVTIAFMTLALSQLFHVFNARAEVAVIFGRRLLANGWVWAALALTVGLQLLAVYQPELSGALRTTPLGAEDWELVLVASLVPLLCGQLWKAWRAPRRSRGGLRPPG